MPAAKGSARTSLRPIISVQLVQEVWKKKNVIIIFFIIIKKIKIDSIPILIWRQIPKVIQSCVTFHWCKVNINVSVGFLETFYPKKNQDLMYEVKTGSMNIYVQRCAALHLHMNHRKDEWTKNKILLAVKYLITLVESLPAK